MDPATFRAACNGERELGELLSGVADEEDAMMVGWPLRPLRRSRACDAHRVYREGPTQPHWKVDSARARMRGMPPNDRVQIRALAKLAVEEDERSGSVLWS